MTDPELVLHGDARYTSPWVLSVWTALEEKALPFRYEKVNLQAGEQRRGTYPADTLTAKVPALRHGDFWLAESLAIVEYLEEAFPDRPRLLPVDVRARARDRHILSWLRSDLFELRRCMPFDGIFRSHLPEPVTEAAREQAETLLRVVARRIETRDALRPTLADFDLAFTMRRLIHYGYGLERHDQCVTFADAIWRRPSVQSWVGQRRAA